MIHAKILSGRYDIYKKDLKLMEKVFHSAKIHIVVNLKNLNILTSSGLLHVYLFTRPFCWAYTQDWVGGGGVFFGKEFFISEGIRRQVISEKF